MAAAAEGVLILIGSGVIIYAAIRSLVEGPELEVARRRHRRASPFSTVVNFGVSTLAVPPRPRDALRRAGGRRRPPAHRRLHLAGVLIGLALVQITGAEWLDPVVALVIAGAIVVTGLRIVVRSWGVLVDEALPDTELRAIREAIQAFAGRGVVGYHKLRTRRAGARRYVDLHVQFESGTSLEDAHGTAHALQDAIDRRAARRHRRADPSRAGRQGAARVGAGG